MKIDDDGRLRLKLRYFNYSMAGTCSPALWKESPRTAEFRLGTSQAGGRAVARGASALAA